MSSNLQIMKTIVTVMALAVSTTLSSAFDYPGKGADGKVTMYECPMCGYSAGFVDKNTGIGGPMHLCPNDNCRMQPQSWKKNSQQNPQKIPQ